LKKKKVFLFEFSFWAETSARPSRPPHAREVFVAQPVGAVAQWFTRAHPRSEAESNPLSKSDPIVLDLT
jgi:hypothetical protein